jgi:ribonuclease HII
MAKVIEILRPDLAIVDAADVFPDRYRKHIVEPLSFAVDVIAEHKADRKYPVVSAASIIAKVERDRVIEELKKCHGDFGSGYTSDEKTIRFLRVLAENNCDFPDYVRRTWKPARLARQDATTKQVPLELV